jgi:hypothetical protein
MLVARNAQAQISSNRECADTLADEVRFADQMKADKPLEMIVRPGR